MSDQTAPTVPLLSLAKPAIDLGECFNVGGPGERDLGVITKISGLIKDGVRLENLAWRHWSGRRVRSRRLSSSSTATESTASLATPISEDQSFTFPPSRPTFGKALQRVLEPDTTFRDWVTEAKIDLNPIISLPDTPVADLQIRVVEPTPVPSRVPSGGNLAYTTVSAVETSPQAVETITTPLDEAAEAKRKGGKFFLPSSPVKDSSDEDRHTPSPGPSASETSPQASTSLKISQPKKKARISDIAEYHSPITTRPSASAEQSEESGWEDEDEEGEEEEEHESEWSDEDNEDPSSPLNLKTSKQKRTTSPPPPTRKLTKKEREAAAAEKAKKDAELDAQRKREMFAKKQIFGKGEGQGLLSGMIKAGGSMVDLTKAGSSSSIRPSPTHGDLQAMKAAHAPAPALLRSKSAVAVPLQTGLSVTASPGKSALQASRKKMGKSTSYDMESSGSEDDYLATSVTRRKLDDIAARKENRTASPQLISVPQEPDSPTAQRRAIIMRQMSESLRRNLILEREKSSAGLTRPNTAQKTREPTPVHHRPQQSILGGGFLRPLTSNGGGLNRAKSSANLASRRESADAAGSDRRGYAAPPMVRSSTDGEGVLSASQRAVRRKELAKRSETMDTSYRIHGW